MTDQFIPLRSRQATIPFALVPDTGVDVGTSRPNIYSYKTGTVQFSGKSATKDDNRRFLGIYPDSFELALQEDISTRMQYGSISKDKTNTEFTINTLLETLPAITVREYLPDPRINSTIHYFSRFFSILGGIFSKKTDDATADKQATSFSFKNLQEMFSWTFNKITGSVNGGKTDEAIWNKLTLAEQANVGGLGSADSNLKKAIFNFPFTMYYLFQSSITTNIYEFPFVLPDGRIYSSTGHEGWRSGNNEFSITGLLSKIPGLGTILQNTLGNISVAYLPWWDSVEGRKTEEPEINIKFHLFNDNITKALTNFLCVNTFIANNRWYQYNMFQHSPSLYEIKLEGSNRLFACTCSSTINGIGNFRCPPSNFFELLKPHCTGLVDSESTFTDKLKNESLVKIPDVYEVTLNFKSLLPSNFNNFIYQYSAADVDMESNRTKEKVTESIESIVTEFKDKAIKKFNELVGG